MVFLGQNYGSQAVCSSKLARTSRFPPPPILSLTLLLDTASARTLVASSPVTMLRFLVRFYDSVLFSFHSLFFLVSNPLVTLYV